MPCGLLGVSSKQCFIVTRQTSRLARCRDRDYMGSQTKQLARHGIGYGCEDNIRLQGLSIQSANLSIQQCIQLAKHKRICLRHESPFCLSAANGQCYGMSLISVDSFATAQVASIAFSQFYDFQSKLLPCRFMQGQIFLGEYPQTPQQQHASYAECAQARPIFCQNPTSYLKNLLNLLLW